MGKQQSNIFDLEDLPIVLDAKDLQKVLKMSKPAVYALMDKPSFGAFRIGRCKRITREAFKQWLESHSAQQNKDFGTPVHKQLK